MTAIAPQSSLPPLYLNSIKDTLNVCFLPGTVLHVGDNVALFRGVKQEQYRVFSN